MTRSSLLRLSGLANILGGIAIALFVIEHPWGHFVGAETVGGPAWMIAHALHLIGASFALLGLMGLYVCQAERLGRAGLAAFLLAFVGTAFFVGTGLITAFVWPMLATVAPAAVDADGAGFDLPALAAFSLTAVLLLSGYLAFGAVSWRAGRLPRGPLLLWALGGAAGMVPPEPLGPLPWAGLVLAGVLYGIGAAGLGWWLWRRSPDGPPR